MTDVKEIIDCMYQLSEKDKELIQKAYIAAEKAHAGQTRLTGDPYFIHVFETAKTLAKLHMCPQSVAAGLLHDTIEDNLITEEDFRKKFGNEILFLVQGVTKLGKLHYHGLQRHAESLRKLFIATAQDIRVLIIRLADRLHNAQTLNGHVSKEKRKRIALETLEIFAPIADRLGIGHLRGALEDAAFPYAYPKEYEKTRELLRQKSMLNQDYIDKIRRSLQKELAKQHITVSKVDHRVKHTYSLYKKLLRHNMNIDEIYDFVAIRIIVPTISNCYQTLGMIHSMWRPLPGRIKDYIAVSKPNGYQSLHTTVFTGDGGIVEVQIRTMKMHAEAEYGIASHLTYKYIVNSKNKSAEKQIIKRESSWINQLLEWQKGVSESGEFLESLKVDFFKDRVFVFTPEGDVIDLPEDSSPIDFAFTIHTDIGNHTSGAKVNGKMVSLDTRLKNGDIVEIITRKNAWPNNKWLKHAKTAIARRHIRIATQEKSNSILKNFLPNINRRHHLL